ncbi:MAG: hypothetical protein Pg6B_09310 [Candidatus Azobacteroides pseudotrichonymphae]|jgi:hypothetical protein|nr:MAG: hypothetical protein Pg6B_09310 [Candidatus Azobacteroides pseudotrichonymphae]
MDLGDILLRLGLGLFMTMFYYRAMIVIWETHWHDKLRRQYPDRKKFSWWRGHYVWIYEDKKPYVDEWDQWELENK